MKKFKLNAIQRLMATQALNTWRGKIESLRNMAVAADVVSLAEAEKKKINYAEIGASVTWDKLKGRDTVVELELEDAQFDAMYEFLKNYTEWLNLPGVGTEIVKMFDVLENAK